MYPILFVIPFFDRPIYSFGAMIAVAYFFGSIYFERLAKKFGDDPQRDPAKFASIALWLLAGILGGGRVMYVIVHPEEFFTNRSALEGLIETLKIWNGGMVFYGGFIAAFLIGLWQVRRHGLRTWHAADLGMIAGFLGLGIGRIGCLLVGDDHGKLCDESLPFPIAIRIPANIKEIQGSYFPAEWAGQKVYATQIWMMINGLGLGLLGRWMLSRRKFAGQITFMMCGIYAVSRGFIEYFRGDDVARGFTEIPLFGSDFRLYTSMKVGLVLLPLSIAMYWYLRRRSKLAA